MSFVIAAVCLSWLAAAGAAQEKAAEKATEVGAAACAGCHAEHSENFKKSKHGKRLPAVKKIDFEKSCESCHGPGSLHAAAGGDKSNPGFATIKKTSGLPAVEVNATCLGCHKQKGIMLWGTSAHKQAGLSCLKCHSVHDGKGKAQLAKDATETCIGCHKKEGADMQLPSHHPVREGKLSCVGCHNPHGGAEGNLAKETLEDTCFQCHVNKAGPFAYEHPPVVESCATCHKPHGSVNESLLKQSQPTLCMTCHKWPHVQRANGVGALRVSGLQQRGRCTDCHKDIHGSERHVFFKN
jgi:DmsE family decaheme c-type cytochrome